MDNSAKNLSDQPFFTKLGFFTKKGYVFILLYTLIIDNIYVLIFGKDKLAVILFALPYIVGTLALYQIAFIGGHYIFSKIKSLFGIDITSNRYEKGLPTPLLLPLFAEKRFQDFQSYASNRFNKRWINYGAILFSIPLILGMWGPFLFFQVDEWIEMFPELAENGLYYVYLVFRVAPLSIFLVWFFFSIFSLLFLIIEIMIIFNALGNFSGLSLNKISEYFDSTIVTEKSNEKDSLFSQNSDVLQFSLKLFRKKCRIIPEMFLKINIGISIVAFVGIMALIYFSNILDDQLINFAILSFIPVTAGIMLFNLIVFIFPQYSLHRHLDHIKEFFLEKFEEKYEIKRFQYLNFTSIENLEEKQLLLSELQTLSQIIEDTEGILTWPFNFNHLTTLLVGLIFPFLPLLIEILFFF